MLTFGLANVNNDPDLMRVAGWLAWASAAPIWFSAAVAAYTHTVKAVAQEAGWDARNADDVAAREQVLASAD